MPAMANDSHDKVRRLQQALAQAAKRTAHASARAVVGKPDEGKPHVRFDEGVLETPVRCGP